MLRELWGWREQEAIAANRPPYFILSSEVVIGIAAASLDSGRDPETLIPKHLTPRRRRGVMDAVAAGRKVHPLPPVIRIRALGATESSKRRFSELEKIRDKRAAELGIDATLIASRAVLVALSHDWDEAAPELMRWQRDLLESVS